MAPGSFEVVTDMTGGGVFNLPAGAFTDDSSMALCLAESLIECRAFDADDQLRRYLRWWREGRWSSTGFCFDIGGTTAAALTRFERTQEAYPGDANPSGLGNGSLMRLASVVLAYGEHPKEVDEYAALSSRTTHGARAAVDACRYFAALLLAALHGASAESVLDNSEIKTWARQSLDPAVAAVADGSYHRKQPPEIRGSGHVIDCLEAALWAVDSADSFEAAVLAAANLGDDADTTAAVCGQLAGAIYGFEKIPLHWRELLMMGQQFVDFADALFLLAHR
jgi:ADP-ribosyl-[dinitrogen reductase] hydrolase